MWRLTEWELKVFQALIYCGIARTCWNNCTESVLSADAPGFSVESLRYLASHGVVDPYSLEQLAKGLRVFTDSGRIWWVSNGQLQFERLFDEEGSEFDCF